MILRCVVMKFAILSLLLITINCGQEPTGAPRSVRAVAKGVKSLDNWIREFRKHYFKYPIDALDWIKLHPKIKTTGIKSNLFADELNVSPTAFGRWVNDENDLVTVRLSANRYIFHIDFAPKEQVADALKEFPIKQFKQEGVPIEEIAKHVHFKQPEWNDHSLHTAIGIYVDRTEFVVPQMKDKKVIFRKGFTPEEQVADALKEFPAKQFKQEGVPIEEIAKHVHFKQPEWNDHSLHKAIGRHINKKEFVAQLMSTKRLISNKSKRVIFRKGFTPKEQVANALKEFPIKQFEQEGVPIEEIAKHVHFKQSEWDDHGLHTAIGKHMAVLLDNQRSRSRRN